MIKSMTGFGQVLVDNGQVQISVEIRSLNSKFLDLNLRLPKSFSEKELEIRSLISERLERGKISIAVDFVKTGDQEPKQTYNTVLFKKYYAELQQLAGQVGASQANIFELALESPDVIQLKVKEEVMDEEWSQVRNCITEAIHKCEAFRISEGKVLGKMLTECGDHIRENLKKVEALDPKRVTRIRERLKGNVTSFFGEEGYDTNRLEQEILFYIEKLDINEEKVRLKSHLDYFQEVINEPQAN